VFFLAKPSPISFLILFILFVVAIELNEPLRINIPETLFMLYGLGFALEKLATMQEHGITGRFLRSQVRADSLMRLQFILRALG
jgi:hypothetical protein